jgi:hypothetical protein
MKIRVLTAAIALAAFTATPALACSLNLTPRPGETETQAADRIYRSAQDRLWTEADVVFIGDVRSLQRSGGSVMVGVRPHRFLKGQASKALLTYAFADDSQFACSFTGFPNVITPGLFYARQTSEGLNVTGMLNVRQIRDPALQQRVNAQIDEIVETPDADPAKQSTLPDWLPWAAGACLISLLIGFLIGRGRTARAKESTTS